MIVKVGNLYKINTKHPPNYSPFGTFSIYNAISKKTIGEYVLIPSNVILLCVKLNTENVSTILYDKNLFLIQNVYLTKFEGI